MFIFAHNIDWAGNFTAKIEYKLKKQVKTQSEWIKIKIKDLENDSKDKEKEGANDITLDGRDWLSVAKDASPQMNMFVSEMYVAGKTNDLPKLRSSHKERATTQYWKFCEQNRFSDLFLTSLSANGDDKSAIRIKSQIIHIICDALVQTRVTSDDLVNLPCQCYPSKSRDIVWLHRYLLDTNIWLQTVDGDDDKNNSDNKEKKNNNNHTVLTGGTLSNETKNDEQKDVSEKIET